MIKVAMGITVVILLSGCGTVPPQVSYKTYAASSDGNSEFAYPFRHRRSLLRIKKENDTFKVEAAPSELDVNGEFSPLYMIRGIDDFRAGTQLKVTYLDNTKIPDKIDVTTKDNLADTINKIGDVISAAVPLVAGVVAAPTAAGVSTFKDTVIDPGEITPEQWIRDEINVDYCLKISDISTEDGVAVTDYLTNRNGKKVVDFPVPSCTTAVVHIAQCKNQQAATRVRVTFAAYNKVTPMPLPSSGSLKMNSVCGASVTEADKQDRSDLTTYLQTLMTNVNNIKAAAKKK